MSRSRLSARCTTCALAALISLLVACDNRSEQPPTDATPAPSNQEQPIAAQIAAVERGDTTTIRIEHASVTDADLLTISRLESVTDLLIPNTDVTSTGLAPLATLPHLENLRLGGPRINDDAIKPVAKCASLRFLIIEHAPITDAGLAHLHQLDKLESLYLIDTQATDAGVDAMKRARPQLHIHW